MELKEFLYWSLYTIVTGLVISMMYISGLNIDEEKLIPRISAIIFLMALLVFYFIKSGADFMWIVKYTAILFLGIFGLYLVIQFLGSFSGYDLISYHGLFILATIIVVYYIFKFFNRVVKDV